MSFESFKQFLKEQNNVSDEEIHEQALASYGDFGWGLSQTATSKQVMSLHWKKIDVIKTNTGVVYELHKMKNSDFYRVGKWEEYDDLKFVSYAEIELGSESICNKNYKSVNLVQVSSKVYGSGIATELYKSLVKCGVPLMSDTVQYFGARKLWAKLSKAPDVIVDVIDTKTCKNETGIKIYHGNVNDAFDETIWSDESRDYIAQNIRLILRDVL